MKFVQLKKSLKEGTMPAYLIEGDDAYFRDSAVNAIRAALNISQPLLNDVRYEGEALKGDAVRDFTAELFTLPMFDEKRLVRVYEFYPSARDFEKLEGYLENPCPSTVLLIVNGGAGKKNGVDLKKKKFTVVDCGRESEETLTRWLFGLMENCGLDADSDACSLMVSYCVRDAARLKQETNKLKSLLGEGGRVTRKVVEEEIAKDAEYKIYELTQAASKRQFAKFGEVLTDLMQKGFDEYAVLSSLTSHYRTLAEIASMRGSDEEVGKALSQSSYAIKKNREIISRTGREKCEEMYLALYSLGAGARSGKYTKAGALTAAITKIFFG